MFYRPDNKSVCADVIPFFEDGEFKLCYLDSDLLVFSRAKGSEKFITIVNNSDRVLAFAFDNKAHALLSDKVVTEHSLDPYGAGIYKVSADSKLEMIGGNL